MKDCCQYCVYLRRYDNRMVVIDGIECGPSCCKNAPVMCSDGHARQPKINDPENEWCGAYRWNKQ